MTDTDPHISIDFDEEEDSDEEDSDAYIRTTCSGCGRTIGLYASELEIFMLCDNCTKTGGDEGDEEDDKYYAQHYE